MLADNSSSNRPTSPRTKPSTLAGRPRSGRAPRSARRVPPSACRETNTMGAAVRAPGCLRAADDAGI